MPRTRAQAHAQEVESPLVSLDNAPRRRRRTTVASPTKSSADTQKATDTKLKRGRKPTKKATVVATAQTSEENTQNKSLVATAEAKENRLRAEKEAQAKAKAAQQAEEQQKPSPLQEQHEKLSAKQKGKKRTRDSNNDDIQADEAPRARRRRVTTSVARNARPGQTPGKRRTLTSIPGRNLSYSEMVRQRAMGREKIKAQPSMFQLDEAQLQEQERAAQAAEEAEEEEARNAITRAAMAPHMVSGPVPENLQSSFEVPVFEEEDEYDSEIEDADMTEPIQTPSLNNWGIRNFITTVTGSVRRRLVPFVRQAPDQAVPFAAGGGATPVQADGAANGPTNREAAPSTQINDTEATSAETNGTQNADAMDLTYSLFPRPPPPPPPPKPAQLSKEKAKADKKEDERGETAAIDKETVQVQETEQTNSNVANGEPQNADTQAEPDTGRNKRKRAPSPDVIPNPPGVSYGFDPDYFTYSDEEIEEAEEYCRREAEAAAAAAAAKPQVSTPTARPPEKRARFLPPEPEASNVQSTNTGIATTQPNWPPTPPGWARPTTTVYNGEMFKGMTHHQANHQAPGFPYYPPQDYQPVPRPLDSDHMHPMPKTYPSSGSLSDLRRVAVERRLKTRLHKARNHVNNLSGAPASLFPQSQPVQQPSIQAFAQQPVSQPAQPISQQISQQPLQQPISQPPREQSAQQIFPQQHAKAISSDVPPLEQTRDRSKSVIAKTNVTDETIHLPPIKPMSAAARGQPVTERSRPKTPSRLRNRIPLSSSPASQGSPAQAPFAAPQQNQEDLLQVFGDDEHGHRAYELFQSCPSGDLRKVQWPSFDPLPADDIQQTIRATPLSAEQQRINREMFQRSLEQFENELDQGLVDPEEILGDLPL